MEQKILLHNTRKEFNLKKQIVRDSEVWIRMQIWILLPSSKYGKIWIQGTMLLTYGKDQDPDPAPGSAIFVLDLQDTDQKQLF